MDFSNYDDLDLLIAVIRGEAESESFIGKIAIACIVRNRVNDKKWPDNYRDVILQPKQFSCFTKEYYRPDILKHYNNKIWWKECKFTAWGILHNCISDQTKGSNLYWNPDIVEKPNWDWSKITILDKIGKHQFAKE